MSKSLSALARENEMDIQEFGEGRQLLLLHGGGGRGTLEPFARSLADRFQVFLPTHPGFDGTARRDTIASARDLACAYVDLVAAADMRGLLVAGFSMGGWIAAEMAALHSARLAGLILVDAVGLSVPGETILDVFTTPPSDLPSYSYHRPERFRIDPASLGPERRAAIQANLSALAAYDTSPTMQDESLVDRLRGVDIPALVLWGASDRVATPTYGGHLLMRCREDASR
ncbi:alpha/beta fold hydrolase [Consotaella salsifontis]|uniref:Pimeloyl-ACP methyl ester carboxylesterase n=1 Tax=Consotaella salsifontis TaxID=1365950 RepID=A0A1T4NM82_9HYPH|nr:alpha/beta fold hydrolase [Consotaella salsifontis]SJZ79858.1 Pimeloyl-ACP methyl ester carboxylesterase [Consotaella salsifontis]